MLGARRKAPETSMSPYGRNGERPHDKDDPTVGFRSVRTGFHVLPFITCVNSPHEGSTVSFVVTC